MKQSGLHVIYAAAVRDAAGINARPGAVVVEDGCIHYAGDLGGLDPERVQRAQAIDKRDSLVLPGMVNAHAHLELTDIGPQPYDPRGGFVGWVRMLRSSTSPHLSGRRESTGRGVGLALEAGVQAVGDIATDALFLAERIDRQLDRVAYLEVFGLGPPYDRDAFARIGSADGGLQPHAPYSAGPSVYEAAVGTGRPVTTHLAETLEEARWVAQGDGPWLDYLKAIDRWDDTFADHYGQGLSPVQWMRPYLQAVANVGGWLVAHCNYVDDDDIKLLADTNTSVAYCPIASEYFGHKDHRYRDMLDSGVNVCLGTDSIVCAEPDDPQPMGMLGAMRRLYQRDGTDPGILLAMATTHGAKALRMDGKAATLQPGAPARFACIPIGPSDPADPLVQALDGQSLVEGLSLL